MDRITPNPSTGADVALSACFVTPSYAGDFTRCKLLAESRRVCAPSIEHFIVVDRHDLELFRPLAGEGTHVVDSRELLDRAFHKVPGDNGWWWSMRTPPLRGWITQQLRKLAMPRLVGHDILINLDSDVVFVGSFELTLFLRENRLGLFEVDYRNDEIRSWSKLAAKMVGIPAPIEPCNYVGMLIPWWRRCTLGLTQKIEDEAGMPWQIALGRQRRFSEYMQYGTYVRHLVGLEQAGHFADTRMLIQTSWHKETSSAQALQDLFGAAASEAVGVMIHSKDGVDPELYADYARGRWRKI